MIVSGVAQVLDKILIGHDTGVTEDGREYMVLKFACPEEPLQQTNQLIMECVFVGKKLDVRVAGS